MEIFWVYKNEFPNCSTNIFMQNAKNIIFVYKNESPNYYGSVADRIVARSMREETNQIILKFNKHILNLKRHSQVSFTGEKEVRLRH